MTESIRTLIYVGVAGVISLVAFLIQPRVEVENVNTVVNKPMFERFTNPLDAKSLEITTFDDKSAALRSFKVAQENGRWVIPSHAGYPADAENQLKDAASGLLGLKALDIASASASDHVMFGVVEPSKEKLKVGDQGVGTLVVIQDNKGSDLLRLIVGKKVDGAEGQHFVRKPGQEPVYVCKVGLDKLPLDFDKWIEKDLLKLNALDVAKVTMKDYSILPSPNRQLYYSPRMEATVAWNSEKGDWLLDKLLLYGNEGPREAPLGDHEELNDQKLNDLKTALDDLKIVDVSRKPQGLGADLKVNAEFSKNEESLDSLAALGFQPVPTADNRVEIMSSNGEVLVEMKDGVQYVLRFGNIQGAQKNSEEGKLNRYLFVTAQLAPSMLTPPQLEPEPAGPAPAETPAKPDDAKPDSAKTEEGSCQEEKAEADDEKSAKSQADEPKSDAKKGDDKGADKPDAAKTAPPVDPNQAQIDQVRKENQRKLDDYNDKKKKAEIRIVELNSRFADWYYVISEDVYKKVHLTRADIIKEDASAKAEGFGVDAFRKLESEGITPPPATPAAPSSPGGGDFPGGFPGGFPNP